MTHKIKLRIDFCDAVLDGRKTFEIRENDRGYQTGDLVKFIPVDKMGLEMPHPVTEKTYRITYLLNGWGLENNYVVFAIAEDKTNTTKGASIDTLGLCTQAYNALRRGTYKQSPNGRWNHDGECKTVEDVLHAYLNRRECPYRLMGAKTWANVAEALDKGGLLKE